VPETRQGRRQVIGVRERSLLGKMFEIDRENPLHRKKSLKLAHPPFKILATTLKGVVMCKRRIPL
jgi:hypothetical protein